MDYLSRALNLQYLFLYVFCLELNIVFSAILWLRNIILQYAGKILQILGHKLITKLTPVIDSEI